MDANLVLYKIFVDLRKAYDRVHRETLWKILQRYGVPNKMIQLLIAMLDNASATVIINGRETRSFPLTRGLKQGSVLSPLLFNIFFSMILRITQDKAAAERTRILRTMGQERDALLALVPEESIGKKGLPYGNAYGSNTIERLSRLCPGVPIRSYTHGSINRTIPDTLNNKFGEPDNWWFHDLTYADDLQMDALSPQAGQWMLTNFDNTCLAFGMEIEPTKTEALVQRRNARDLTPAETPNFYLTRNNTHVPIHCVPVYEYLGVMESEEGTMMTEIRERKAAMWSCFGRLRADVFKNHQLSVRQRMELLGTTVICAGLYSSPSFHCLPTELVTLEATLNDILRIILPTLNHHSSAEEIICCAARYH